MARRPPRTHTPCLAPWESGPWGWYEPQRRPPGGGWSGAHKGEHWRARARKDEDLKANGARSSGTAWVRAVCSFLGGHTGRPWATRSSSRRLSVLSLQVRRWFFMISKVLSGSQTLDYCRLWTPQCEAWKKSLRLQDRFYLHLTTMCSSRQLRGPQYGVCGRAFSRRTK